SAVDHPLHDRAEVDVDADHATTSALARAPSFDLLGSRACHGPTIIASGCLPVNTGESGSMVQVASSKVIDLFDRPAAARWFLLIHRANAVAGHHPPGGRRE